MVAMQHTPPDSPSASAAPVVVAVLSVAVGAVLIVVSGFLVWFRVLGSELTGFRMADLITDVGDSLEVAPPGWMGAVWYLLPLVGVGSWLVLFLTKPVRATVIHAALGAAVVAAVSIYMVVAADRGELTPGPVVATVGGLLVLGGGLVGHWVGRPTRL